MDEMKPTQEQEEEKALRFALELGAMLPLFQPVLQESSDFWMPDQPPSVVLLGDLGSQFARGFFSLSAEAQASVLDKIEQGVLLPNDDYLGTVVSTGFLEGVIHRAERDETWPTIRLALRPLSREFADAYMNDPVFNGPTQPQEG